MPNARSITVPSSRIGPSWRPAPPRGRGPLLGTLALLVACHAARAQESAIDTMSLRRVAAFLASDELRGRGTGTPGEAMAASFLADRCRSLGLEAVGSDSYHHPVALERATILESRTRVRITGPGKDTTFVLGEEFIPDVGTAATLRGFAGRLAYVGRARDLLFRRSDLPDLRGAVALMRGELGAWGEAADTLFARGAVGLIQVVDDARRYRLFRATRGPVRLYLADSASSSSFMPVLPAILAGPRMTVTLYEGLTGVTHGSWNDAYLNGLAAGLPSPRLLEGWRAEVTVGTRAEPVTARNVACVLRGRGPAADTAIALAAHYDHLGVGEPDLAGDSIYNGFSDNATGVAMALGVAEALARDRSAGRGLRHSLLLLFFTGEEQGLLGADAFAARPAWPLGRIRALLNLDANAPAGPPRAWRIAGDDASPLVRLVDAEARRQGWETTLAPPAPGSDYYAFHRRGVPSVFFVPSDGPYEGVEMTVSDSLRAAVWGRYHRPGDEYRADFPFTGLQRYAAFTRDVVRRLDAAR